MNCVVNTHVFCNIIILCHISCPEVTMCGKLQALVYDIPPLEEDS